MTNKLVSENFSGNPDPQENRLSVDDITHLQEQQTLPDRLPQKLVDWSARILAPAASAGVNRRYQALNQEKINDTS